MESKNLENKNRLRNALRDPFKWSGAFFFLWACYNTFLDVSRYGAGWGLYWWFCNLATFGIGTGLFFRLRDLIAGFLAIASFTQVFWIADNTYRVLVGKALFGLVGSMYQPGLPLDEFISVHYHYFTIPVAIYALFHLPIAKKQKTLWYIGIMNPFIFAVSYFAFPAGQNINCIHSACFSGLDWSGPVYSFGFWAAIFTAHCVFAVIIDFFFSRRHWISRLQIPAAVGFAAALIAVLTISFKDIQYKRSLPKFRCEEASLNPNGLELACDYTRDYSDDSFLLTYSARNLSSTTQLCDVLIQNSELRSIVQKDLALEAGQARQLTTTLANPSKDLAVSLTASCRPR